MANINNDKNGLTPINEKHSSSSDYDIKMDGEFHKFESGAIRYTKTGKGRFDLIPGQIIHKVLQMYRPGQTEEIASFETIIADAYLGKFEEAILQMVCVNYKDKFFYSKFSNMLRELARHYEKGAEKYGVDNWKKGIPLQSFRDSGLRHMSQWMIGMTDENHFIAAVWNFVGYIWESNYGKTSKPTAVNNTTTASIPKNLITSSNVKKVSNDNNHDFSIDKLFNELKLHYNKNKFIPDELLPTRKHENDSIASRISADIFKGSMIKEPKLRCENCNNKPCSKCSYMDDNTTVFMSRGITIIGKEIHCTRKIPRDCSDVFRAYVLAELYFTTYKTMEKFGSYNGIPSSFEIINTETGETVTVDTILKYMDKAKRAVLDNEKLNRK